MSMRFGNMNKDNRYFVVFSEWLYPTESGRDFVGDYDTLEEALAACEESCNEEVENYGRVCGDPLPPSPYSDSPEKPPRGWCITPKNGLEDWWYAAKVMEVEYGI